MTAHRWITVEDYDNLLDELAKLEAKSADLLTTVEGLGQQNTELELQRNKAEDIAEQRGQALDELEKSYYDVNERLTWYRDQAAQYAGRLNRVEDLLQGFDDIPFGDVRRHIDFVLGVVTGLE